MTDEKPLHVRVAEALGWTTVGNEAGVGIWTGLTGPNGQVIEWGGHPPGDTEEPREGELWADWRRRAKPIPRYDTWQEIGPLIERFGIGVAMTQKAFDTEPRLPGDNWIATRFDDPSPLEIGPTPLIAVCNLLLSLHSAGKLKEAK